MWPIKQTLRIRTPPEQKAPCKSANAEVKKQITHGESRPGHLRSSDAQGGINGYGFGRNVYNLYDCAAEFMEDLDKRVTYEYADDTYHTVTTKGGSYCCFCYGTIYESSSKLERHSMVTEVLPQPANGRFAVVEKCSLCDYCCTRGLDDGAERLQAQLRDTA